MSNVIMRPVWNRPEMTELSIEYEIAAREHYSFPGDFLTIFIMEYGTPSKLMDIIKKYPYPYKCIIRNQHYGLTVNILEGMKDVFKEADDYVVYIEDDILIHKTYFKYMDLLFHMVPPEEVTVYSPYNRKNGDDIYKVSKTHHYCAWGAVILKDFYEKYIFPVSNSKYYSNPSQFVIRLNNKYEAYQSTGQYKYKNNMHWEQAGVINRLVDIALIEDNRSVIQPSVNRQMHIGFYGKNRPGKLIGNSYDERLETMRRIIKENKFYEMTAAKQYNDYVPFEPALETWDGTLYLK